MVDPSRGAGHALRRRAARRPGRTCARGSAPTAWTTRATTSRCTSWATTSSRSSRSTGDRPHAARRACPTPPSPRRSRSCSRRTDLELLGLAGADAASARAAALERLLEHPRDRRRRRWSTWRVALALRAPGRDAGASSARRWSRSRRTTWNRYYAPLFGAARRRAARHLLAHGRQLALPARLRARPPDRASRSRSMHGAGPAGLGDEFERMATLGRVTPDVWMEQRDRRAGRRRRAARGDAARRSRRSGAARGEGRAMSAHFDARRGRGLSRPALARLGTDAAPVPAPLLGAARERGRLLGGAARLGARGPRRAPLREPALDRERPAAGRGRRRGRGLLRAGRPAPPGGLVPLPGRRRAAAPSPALAPARRAGAADRRARAGAAAGRHDARPLPRPLRPHADRHPPRRGGGAGVRHPRPEAPPLLAARDLPDALGGARADPLPDRDLELREAPRLGADARGRSRRRHLLAALLPPPGRRSRPLGGHGDPHHVVAGVGAARDPLHGRLALAGRRSAGRVSARSPPAGGRRARAARGARDGGGRRARPLRGGLGGRARRGLGPAGDRLRLHDAARAGGGRG